MAATVQPSLRVCVFPRDDREFAAEAETLLAELDPPDPRELERLLRATHRRARVVPRDSLASLGDGDVWYVYRDGSALPPALVSDFYRQLVDNLYDGVYFVTRSRRITYWNEAAESITGWRAEDVVGRCCQSNILRHCTDEGVELCRTGCPLLASMEDGRHREAIVYLRHHDGHRVAVRVRTGAVRDERGRVVGGVEVFDDATRLVSALARTRELEREVQTDELTGLASRRRLEAEIDAALATYGCSDTRTAVPGVMLVDVRTPRRSKVLGATSAREAALRTVARTLEAAIGTADVAGRWNEGSLLVVLPATTEAELAATAARIRALATRSCATVDGVELRPSVSVRTALALPGICRDDLLGRARVAGRRV